MVAYWGMKTYRVQKGFIVQKLGDKLTIFDGEKSMLYTFNETAGLIFQQLKKGKTEQEIVKLFVKRYKITQDQVKKDVKELLRDLTAKKIVVRNK